MKLNVGLDVSSEKLDAFLGDEPQDIYLEASFSNDTVSANEDKTDRNNAFFVADFFRVDRGKKSIIREEKYLALQRLTRAR